VLWCPRLLCATRVLSVWASAADLVVMGIASEMLGRGDARIMVARLRRQVVTSTWALALTFAPFSTRRTAAACWFLPAAWCSGVHPCVPAAGGDYSAVAEAARAGKSGAALRLVYSQ
jgi:hypothetical protein